MTALPVVNEAIRGFRPMSVVMGEKAVVEPRAIDRSVIETMPKPRPSSGPVPSLDSSVLLFLGQFAEEIAPFGPQIKQRDLQLRNFILKENIFAAALGIICSRNAGFSWKLDGPSRLVNTYQDILENCDMGDGWHSLIVKTTIDLSTQDNGAFWEIVRAGPNANSPVIGINHLDSARCWHTGNKEAPVIYLDRFGKYHLLNWWEVVEFSEMPTPIEGLYGLQYCALSRLLRKAQIMRNDDILDLETSGGQNTKQIHLVKGVTSQQITDAIGTAKTNAANLGYTRYMTPVVVGTIDPTADVGHDTIELASKASTDPEVSFLQYINLIAMAFESDYQEFAPLPGQKLGTGAQSETLHLKSRGKGPGVFMKLITHALNFRVLPAALKFSFDEQDLEAEKSAAEVSAVRAQTRATQIQSGEITTQVARQIAVDEGDLTIEALQLMDEEDITPDITVDSYSTSESQRPSGKIKPGIPAPTEPPGGAGIPSGKPERQSQPGVLPATKPPNPLGTKEAEDDWFEEYQTQVKERFEGLIEQLDQATKYRGVRRTPVRNKQGIIQYIDERPLED